MQANAIQKYQTIQIKEEVVRMIFPMNYIKQMALDLKKQQIMKYLENIITDMSSYSQSKISIID